MTLKCLLTTKWIDESGLDRQKKFNLNKQLKRSLNVPLDEFNPTEMFITRLWAISMLLKFVCQLKEILYLKNIWGKL